MSAQPQTQTTPRPAFGSLLTDTMAVATYSNGQWSDHEVRKTGPIEISPAAHVLHYSSTCFEGFKAYKWADGSVNVFRMSSHIERMCQSARSLALPEPDPDQLETMITTVIDRVRDQVPEAPGALYMRPILFGTTPNIGAAASPPRELMLIVLASPVWDYFSGGMKALKIYVETEATRCASHLGMVKTGGNYAAAMGPTLAARQKYGVDQVLFCPGGEVQETGAANFLLIREGKILTRSLDATFLHGVTRDSLLRMAPSPRLPGRGARVHGRGNARLGEGRGSRPVGHRSRAGRRRHAGARRQGAQGGQRRRWPAYKEAPRCPGRHPAG